MKRNGLWVSPTEFVQFNEPRSHLSEQIATRSRSPDFYALGMYLPNPDPILKALGKDIKVYRELRADAQVGGNMRRRKSAVKALEWGVKQDKASTNVAASIQDILADLPMRRIISEIMDAPFYGYQPLEVIWGKVGSYLVPVDVIGKPPEWFGRTWPGMGRRLLRLADGTLSRRCPGGRPGQHRCRHDCRYATGPAHRQQLEP